MSSSFSNADTGSRPADPYKAESKDEASLADKIEVLVNFISSCKFGMMTTRDPSSNKLVSRCMAIAAKESGGIDLLFFTNTESHKTDELSADPHVNISFLDDSGQWASVSGTATIETDRNLVRQHYRASLKAWLGDLGDGTHDGSAEDPRIGVIRVKTGSVTYMVTDKTLLGRVSEIAKGTVTGNVATPNKLREVSESEVSQWRASH
ncbi:hypothetical protein DL764_000271 [Monosporascus ibericus]|uniref:General stress protein FMN-binding split barrel domain-containing protein n=1 Tax=Monosporascus ibericus TaxID=155417 RepID=A0A4Q4TZM7_9PEZI|nr:hypothetical protein DL764_000271 [Monosporascus ibericus]